MKSLDNILNASKPLHLTEDDEALETPAGDGDVTLVMARLSDIIDMADDLYNTASSLADIDEGTQGEVEKIYNCLDSLYKKVDDDYGITTSEYDFDADGVDDLEEAKYDYDQKKNVVTISKDEWKKIHNDFKMKSQDGKSHFMLANAGGKGTVVANVKFESTESEEANDGDWIEDNYQIVDEDNKGNPTIDFRGYEFKITLNKEGNFEKLERLDKDAPDKLTLQLVQSIRKRKPLEESTELTEGTLQKSKVKVSNWLEADEYKSLAKADWFESAEWEWMPEKKLYGRKAMVEAKALTVAKLKNYNWLSSEEYASVRSKVGFKPEDWAWDEGRMLYKRVDKYSETYKRIIERLLGEKVPLEFKELAEDSETIIVPENKKLSNAALKKIAELYLEKKLKIGYKAENKEIAEKVAAIFTGESAPPAPSKKLESFMKH